MVIGGFFVHLITQFNLKVHEGVLFDHVDRNIQYTTSFLGGDYGASSACTNGQQYYALTVHIAGPVKSYASYLPALHINL